MDSDPAYDPNRAYDLYLVDNWTGAKVSATKKLPISLVTNNKLSHLSLWLPYLCNTYNMETHEEAPVSGTQNRYFK